MLSRISGMRWKRNWNMPRTMRECGPPIGRMQTERLGTRRGWIHAFLYILYRKRFEWPSNQPDSSRNAAAGGVPSNEYGWFVVLILQRHDWMGLCFLLYCIWDIVRLIEKCHWRYPNDSSWTFGFEGYYYISSYLSEMKVLSIWNTFWFIRIDILRPRRFGLGSWLFMAFEIHEYQFWQRWICPRMTFDGDETGGDWRVGEFGRR